MTNLKSFVKGKRLKNKTYFVNLKTSMNYTLYTNTTVFMEMDVVASFKCYK